MVRALREATVCIILIQLSICQFVYQSFLLIHHPLAPDFIYPSIHLSSQPSKHPSHPSINLSIYRHPLNNFTLIKAYLQVRVTSEVAHAPCGPEVSPGYRVVISLDCWPVHPHDLGTLRAQLGFQLSCNRTNYISLTINKWQTTMIIGATKQSFHPQKKAIIRLSNERDLCLLVVICPNLPINQFVQPPRPIIHSSS